MTDVKSANNPLYLREEELRQAIELLFFAYRDFTAGPDQILKDYNFGACASQSDSFRRPE